MMRLITIIKMDNRIVKHIDMDIKVFSILFILGLYSS